MDAIQPHPSIALPAHYRMEDWVTYALVWHLRLAKTSPEAALAATSVPSLCSVSSIQSVHGDAIPLHHVLSAEPDKAPQTFSVLRLLAAGLRYVYLTNDHAIRADMVFCGDAKGLTIETGSGSKYFVAESSVKERGALAFVILSGSPLSWFSLPDWGAAAPLEALDAAVHRHQQFHSEYSTLLTSLGALPMGDGRWSAPPGNTLFDLSAYVVSGQHGGSARVSAG